MDKEKTKILFVCMGNICRSPTAEGTFRSQVDNKNLNHLFEIDSAGTHAYHVGESPDARSQKTAIKYGVDLSKQKARQVHNNDFHYYDYIIAMDSDNLSILQSICPQDLQYKLSLMLDNLPDTKNKSVPDPYFEGLFDDVFMMLNRASKLLLLKLLTIKI